MRHKTYEGVEGGVGYPEEGRKGLYEKIYGQAMSETSREISLKASKSIIGVGDSEGRDETRKKEGRDYMRRFMARRRVSPTVGSGVAGKSIFGGWEETRKKEGRGISHRP